MRSRHALVLSALSVLAPSSIAQSSLCTQDEVTEWSCTAKGKIYSVCSSEGLSPTTGYMQYRAGTTSKTEFAFPEPPRHPKGFFHLNLLPRGASLGFSNGGYEYAIDEPLAGATFVAISKGQGPVAFVTCKSATRTLTLNQTMDRFKLLGIDQ
jgi:hypothetical protein